MIKYALVCDKGHDFESWIADSAAYDKQVKRKLIACPVCDSVKVEKALMAPRVTTSKRKAAVAMQAPAETPAAAPAPEAPAPAPVAMMSPQEQEFRSKLKELRDHLVKNSENVGEKFSDEARKMHYGEIEHRSIHGVASPEEAKELVEEGVEFLPLPVLPDERN
jgi:hypothetical protein